MRNGRFSGSLRVTILPIVRIPHFSGSIGVGNGFRRPRPPNRACGFPAHGSPVGGFLIGIGTLHMNCDDGEQPLCREQDISYLSHVTPLSGASNMRSLHSEASAHDRLGPFASAPCLTLTGTAGARPCSRRGSHAIHLPISLPSERFCFPLLQRVTSQRYYEDSDSCSAHPPRRSPHLLRHTFLSFRLQPRRLPDHRLPPRQRVQRVSDFAMNEQARRSSPPNRVRHPTDRQFASGCSPPRLAATQLPSASEFVAFSDTDFHRADVAPSWAHSYRRKPVSRGI